MNYTVEPEPYKDNPLFHTTRTPVDPIRPIDVWPDQGTSIPSPSTIIEKGLRFNEGKRKWSLVDYKSLEPMVEVLEFGAKKYTPDNWKKGLDKKEILESMMRHLTALMDGETHDKESGIHHIGHIGCNYLFYSYFARLTGELKNNG